MASPFFLSRPMKTRTAVMVLVSLGTFAAICCGRRSPREGRSEATAPAPREQVENADTAARTKRDPSRPRPVIAIGLDGLDWEILDSLTARGLMPNWKRLVDSGYSAELESFAPLISPVVWTTVATGVGPDVHGVLDFQEVDPKTGAKAPISGASRKVSAVWNIASRAGRSVGVVGWWATHPAEEVNGFFVTDHASPILFQGATESGTAFPTSLDGAVAEVVRREGSVTASDLSRFLDVPQAEVAAALASGAGIENRMVALSRVLKATRVYHRLARELYDRNLPDLMLLYLEGTDEVAHLFAPFTEPKLDCVSAQDFARYRRVVPEYYALVDRLLGQWMRRAEEDGATLIVLSDHGFKWGAGRPCDRPSAGANTAAYWHRMRGVLAAWRQGIPPSRQRGRERIFDIAPALLAFLKIAPPPVMPGHAIAALNPPHDLQANAGWFAGDVRRVAARPPSVAESAEYTRKLMALGYLSGADTAALRPTGGDRPGMTEGAWNNLGLYFRDTRKDLPAARAAFQKALELKPDYVAGLFNLAVVERFRGRWRESLDPLFRSFAAGHPAAEKTILQWAGAAIEEKRPQIAVSILERGIAAYPRSEEIARALALQRFQGKDCERARGLLAPFAASSNKDTLNLLGLSELCVGHREAARGFLERSLALDPAQPSVREALAFIEKGR